MSGLRARHVRVGFTLATVGVLALGAACSSSGNSKSASKSKGVVTPGAEPRPEPNRVRSRVKKSLWGKEIRPSRACCSWCESFTLQ